ncbi:hypothetical protein HYC85_005082 [Camellia sinensis]|uniref:Gamma-secretase subunit PEN-2 n=1 Tax=Camellia sinensis TaxID=4442 RepID=A0A7J7HZN3_CAMSI|nr:hypothetical protein HYC85_005082 [Camellia sinensis]
MERSENNAPSESAELILPRINPNPNTNNNPNSSSSLSSQSQQRGPQWPTIDGPLGLSEEASIGYARRFFKFGFFIMPFLWALNCLYFWPVLRHSRSFPQFRRYVVGSAVGFVVFTGSALIMGPYICHWRGAPLRPFLTKLKNQ